ncbi:protein trichome birefringence-like 37 [Primulina eburnea]|uniref:protein trichome birefringence-like 37 n=1 Tax=Primulina eburnea TaxID=1245227 RepID=UPI003C6C6CD9
MELKFQYSLKTLIAIVLFASSKADLVQNVSNFVEGPANGCDWFNGQWKFDPSYPLYESSSHPFIDPQFNCQKFGRPDNKYLSYSWKPKSCNLPRFDGAGFLRRWKVKKIIFVGDSLSLNRWSSLACMLHAAVPKANTTFLRKGPITQVTFEDYHVIIFLYRTPYLVDIVQEQVGRVLKLDLIQQGNAWRGMAMLISNTWHRWTHTGNVQPWDFVQYGSTITKDMDVLVAFSKGLTTWDNWVEKNVDPSKIKVFCQGISPTHYMYVICHSIQIIYFYFSFFLCFYSHTRYSI